MTEMDTHTPMLDRFHGALLGLAVGDAIGTTVEFKPRGKFEPLTDMVGGGPFGLPPGAWTDDTSMALCLASSLIERQGFDPKDQMERYCRWHEEGYMSSTGECFDIGMTVYTALQRFRNTGDPFSGLTNERSAGNGCLMRLAPVPMFFHHDRELAIAMSGESARTTHGARECVEASKLFGAMLHAALDGAGKHEMLLNHGLHEITSPKIREIADGAYRGKRIQEIRGSGYVVESLEAALWCFDQTDGFGEAVLLAANLGDDADTTAAICGQLAGAFYGEKGIPEDWLNKLFAAEAMRVMAEELALCSFQNAKCRCHHSGQ